MIERIPRRKSFQNEFCIYIPKDLTDVFWQNSHTSDLETHNFDEIDGLVADIDAEYFANIQIPEGWLRYRYLF